MTTPLSGLKFLGLGGLYPSVLQVQLRVAIYMAHAAMLITDDATCHSLFFAPPSLELQLARAARMHVRGLMPPPPRLSMPLMGSVHGCAGAVAQVRSHTRSTRVP